MNQSSFSCSTNNTNIILNITGYDEPCNGRNLWKADLFMNGVNANNLFQHSRNRLNYNLNDVQFHSPDKQWVFIPAEGNSFLIHTAATEVYYLPQVMLSAVYFLGNSFTDDALIVVYQRLIQIYNWKEQLLTSYNKTAEPLQQFAQWHQADLSATNGETTVLHKIKNLFHYGI
jgi:hypothetical protein